MTIGLARGIVRLEKHQTAWSTLFQQEEAALMGVLAGHEAELEHIGSTAIPALDAKPILDMLLGLLHLSDEISIRPLLESLDYLYRGEQGVPGRVLYVKGSETNRTHHLHITQLNSPFWHEHIYFRDALNAHPEIAQAYNTLKHELALQYADDRVAYTAGKNAFIQTILQTRQP
jgi:GrpB-like predicted nucleotidyltransferase (UPF0157 family)